jgi:carbon starvation protein
MFGVANQLMASIALAVGTTVIINAGKARYAWVTLVPMSFLSITTLTAGWMDVTNQFWPMAVGPDASLHVQGVLQSALTVIMMVCVVVILVTAARKWLSTGVPRPSLVTAD